MTPERWHRIEAIFQQAVDLPHAERSLYLDRACGADADLLREVQNLLESDENAQTGLMAAVQEAAGAVVANAQREEVASWDRTVYVGRRIGPYEIRQEIGRGGMGAVYKAIRVDDQYLRSVAIKLVKQGADTPDTLSRIRMERQILATLQHPNIAALLDGGTTPDGQPYLVMEYIEGEPLIEYCKKRNVSVDDRLELFRQVCAAVQYAHQMLVIHRDIKPGNVLVTASGVPKLLDFGIAKLLAPEMMGDGEWETRTVQRMLTPEYASPEQIRGETLTTATDIYSLGVLLYELLTFSRPYRTTGKSSQEIIRAVCESEPVRLTQSAAVKENSGLRRALSGDLENIVAMTLRKEPQRRYPSAQALADDLQKYRKGMPIAARPDTLVYRVSKLVRRNRLATAAFALLAVSVVAGWTATVRQVRRTERRFAEVRGLAHSVLFEFHNKIKDLPGSTPARELLVQTGLDYLNRLAADASDDLDLQWEISQAYEQVGDVQGDPVGPNLGKFPEAMVSYRKALEMVERVSQQRRDRKVLNCLVWLYYKCGDLEARGAGSKRAVEFYRKGLQTTEEVAKLPKTSADEFRRNGYQRMATALLRTGDIKGALENGRSAYAAAERAAQSRPGEGSRANLARSRMLLGGIVWLTGDLETAWQHYAAAIAELEELVRARPSQLAYRADLEEVYRRAGDLQGNPSYFNFGQRKTALEYEEKALKLAESFVTLDPHNASAQAELSVVLRRAAAVSRTTNPNGSAARYRRAAEILTQLLETAPGDTNYMRDLANTRLGLGVALRYQNRPKAALEELMGALAIQEKLLKEHPERVVLNEDMFDAYLALGDLFVSTGEAQKARVPLDSALQISRMLVHRDPGNLYSDRCVALVSQALGTYHAALGHREEAEKWYGEALRVWAGWRRRKLAPEYVASQESEIAKAARARGVRIAPPAN